MRPLIKGTCMALGALAGMLAAEVYSIGGTGILYVDMVAMAFLGCLAGDGVGVIFGQEISTGATAALTRGFLTAGGAVAGYFMNGYWGLVLGAWFFAVVGDIIGMFLE
jgi:hypothetical protein